MGKLNIINRIHDFGNSDDIHTVQRLIFVVGHKNSMPIIYRTCPNDSNVLVYLDKLGQDNWIYCGQLNDKLIFRKEVKKTRKSTAIVSPDLLEFQKLMRTTCGVSRFKETAERELSMIRNCMELSNDIGMDEFTYRLKTILEDDFKSKHVNKLTYLHRELSAFIHPIVQPKEKASALHITL